MLKNLKNKKKKGFTLIELIIVIAIIAILAALAIPKFGQIRKDAALKSDIANAKTIANAVTALLTEGTVDLGTSEKENSFALSSSGNTGDAKDIEDYLQNVPTPKSTGFAKFNVSINSNGKVSITMVDDKGTNEKDLFPVPVTSID